MEYYKGKWCISAKELEDGGIISQDYCRQLASREKLNIARPGGGKGNYVLVVVDSLPQRYKEKVELIFSNAKQV